MDTLEIQRKIQRQQILGEELRIIRKTQKISSLSNIISENDIVLINTNELNIWSSVKVFKNNNEMVDTPYVFDENFKFFSDDVFTDVCPIQKKCYPSNEFPNFTYNTLDSLKNTFKKYKTGILIIDFKKFLTSNGEILTIKYKENISYEEILRIKKEFSYQIKKATDTINKLSSIVNSIYTKENYDLKFFARFGSEFPFGMRDHLKSLSYTLSIKFENITISNSIEESKFIGTLYITLIGYISTLQNVDTIYIKKRIYGRRSTFTQLDVITSYSHSHLPKSALTSDIIPNFCLGSGEDTMFKFLNYETEDRLAPVSDLDIENILLCLPSYLSWESLEGGPHIKIENTYLYESEVDINSEDIKNTQINRNITHLLKQYILEIIDKCFFLKRIGDSFSFTYNKIHLLTEITKLIPKEIIEDYNGKYMINLNTGRIVEKNQNILNNALKNPNLKTRISKPFFKENFVDIEIIEDNSLKEFIKTYTLTIDISTTINFAEYLCYELNKELNQNEYKNRE